MNVRAVTYQKHEYCMVSDGADALQRQAFQSTDVSAAVQKRTMDSSQHSLNNEECWPGSRADSCHGVGPWRQMKVQNTNVSYVN